MNKIYKIVLTGGPCAGKTSALHVLKSYYEDKGYIVLVVSESATELISGGVSPKTYPVHQEYMYYQTRLQLEKELIFTSAAQTIVETLHKDVIVFFDRGIMDIKAYMKENEFYHMLSLFDITEEKILNKYHLILHLETAAKMQKYVTENNSARYETAAEACILDEKTFSSWSKHTNLVYINVCKTFDEKTNELTNQINALLDNTI